MSTKSVIVVMAILVIAMLSGACAQTAPQNGTTGGTTSPGPIGNATVNATANQTGNGNVTTPEPEINSTINGTGNETAGNGTASDHERIYQLVVIAMGVYILVIFLILIAPQNPQIRLHRQSTRSRFTENARRRIDDTPPDRKMCPRCNGTGILKGAK